MNNDFACPKCGEHSGDNWSQCEGICPMPMSPYFDIGQARRSNYALQKQIFINSFYQAIHAAGGCADPELFPLSMTIEEAAEKLGPNGVMFTYTRHRRS